MATLTTDRGRKLRPHAGLVLLFLASFAVTLWKVQFASPAAPGTASGDWRLANPGVVQPVTPKAMTSMALPGAPSPETTPGSMPAPSLQELALDKDPAVRDEAQALRGLLEMEPVYD